MANAKVPMKETVHAVLRSADGRVQRIGPESRRCSWERLAVWVSGIGCIVLALFIAIGR